MASASFRFMILAILVIAETLVLTKHGVSAQCQQDIPSLVSQCSEYVKPSGPEIQPSQGCCDVVKNLDIPCICKHVTPELEKLISMKKAVFVARSCGLTVKPGMKCGSYVVPPPVSSLQETTLIT